MSFGPVIPRVVAESKGLIAATVDSATTLRFAQNDTVDRWGDEL